ncbi:MAG: carbon starvation protein A, partial [Candidatus Zixiibacteriota bacterium]
MNALVLGLILLIWLFAGYKIYGSWIERKLVVPDDSVPTPAHELRDGVDYSPAKTPVLFGHHFSSIAGAGPIVGP